MDTHALCGMSALTGKVVRGGRVHNQGRRSLFDCEGHKKAKRLSVLFFKNGTSKFIDEDTNRKGVTFRRRWVGATLFYVGRPSGEETRDVYLDTLDGLCGLRRTAEEANDVREVYHEWSRPWTVYELVLNKNANELDPRRFNPLERKKFDETDKAEWAVWIKNRVTPQDLEDKIDRKNIISVPMRYVRTNRGENGGFVAKSRLTIAGHTDPAIGLYRTDAPTTSHLAVLITAVIAANQNWTGYIFDYVTAFLTGESLNRELYTRAPREWLPAVDSTPAVRPFGLLKILKGA